MKYILPTLVLFLVGCSTFRPEYDFNCYKVYGPVQLKGRTLEYINLQGHFNLNAVDWGSQPSHYECRTFKESPQ